MEQNPKKFRLRLNLFDGIVLILALAAGAFLLWNAMKPSDAPVETTTETVRYTIFLQRWLEGTSPVIQEGARLTDSIRNYELGRVTGVQAGPARSPQLDHENRKFVLAELEGYEDVLVSVEAPCTITDEAVTVGGGYKLRVGAQAFIQGDGFLGSGYIYAIEREG